MRKRSQLSSLIAFLGVHGGCDSVENAQHLEQPVIVQQGSFHKGSLDAESEDGPAITSLSFTLGTLNARARSVPLSGRVSPDAYSVAFGVEGQGSGYWIRPVGTQDPSFPGELTFDILFDVGLNAEPGLTTLSVTAIDGDGKAGAPSTFDVCVLGALPDHGNVCDPTVAPPRTIVSLQWNTDADLDLSLVSPSGKIYNRTRRGVVGEDGLVSASFDRDGNAGCVLDSRRTENFVFEQVPEVGTWLVYVNMFDTCGTNSTNFDVSTHTRRKTGDDTYALRRTSVVHGTLLRSQVDGGAGTPLYVTSFDL